MVASECIMCLQVYHSLAEKIGILAEQYSEVPRRVIEECLRRHGEDLDRASAQLLMTKDNNEDRVHICPFLVPLHPSRCGHGADAFLLYLVGDTGNAVLILRSTSPPVMRRSLPRQTLALRARACFNVLNPTA